MTWEWTQVSTTIGKHSTHRPMRGVYTIKDTETGVNMKLIDFNLKSHASDEIRLHWKIFHRKSIQFFFSLWTSCLYESFFFFLSKCSR